MRIFVYEWTCCVPNAPASLRQEGGAMLTALMADFSRAAGTKTITLVHESCDLEIAGDIRRFQTFADEELAFKELAGSCDATVVIAPETDKVLDTRCHWVEEAAGWLLGPSRQASKLASSKSLLAQRWLVEGIASPPILAVGEAVRAVREFPFVLKPDDGAGSQSTFLIRDAAELARALVGINVHNLIAQRYAPGVAASVGILVGPDLIIPLPPGTQCVAIGDQCSLECGDLSPLLSDCNQKEPLPAKKRRQVAPLQRAPEPGFHYLGGTLPLGEPLRSRATNLAVSALQACPGLLGYNGIDLVLGDADDGSKDFAIEINPRLTTSYIGLRHLCRDNLATAMLRIAQGQDAGVLRWREGPIHFHADGTIESIA